MIPTNIRQLVEGRSQGMCEGCQAARATEMHHRRFRSRGGNDTPANLIHLCGWGNHTGCHGIAHSGKRGTALGWAIPSGWVAPAEVPFQTLAGSWWLLDDDGGIRPMEFAA